VARLKFSSKTLREFRTFALRANAIDLAIAVALGAAFTAVVTSLVQDMFTPIIGAIFKTSFATMTFSLNGSVFTYGAVVNAVITFIVVAFTLFFFVVKPVNALRKRFNLDLDPEAPAKAPCPACRTDIVAAARRCPACTEELGENWAASPAR
jgi:large conductance mechanosensitive channel